MRGPRGLSRLTLPWLALSAAALANPMPSAVARAEPAPPTAAAAAVPDGESPPALLLIVPRLLLQTDAVVVGHGPSAPALEDPATSPGLYLRRARLGADLESANWRARLLVELASQSETGDVAAPDGPALDAIAGARGGGAPRPTEAYLAFAPHKAFSVAAGSMRVPIGLSRQIDEGDLRLPERPRIITRATPDFRVGVAASGDLGLFQYAFGTYAAASAVDAARSSFEQGGALYVLRLAAEPVGPMGLAPHLRRRADPWYGWWRFSAGLSAFHARLPGENESGLGGDSQFQWRRLCATGELLWTRRGVSDRVGFSVEPGVFLIPDRLELVARLEWFNDRVGPASPLDAWGATVGATLFGGRARLVRAQLAYTWRHPLRWEGEESASGWAVLRATFAL